MKYYYFSKINADNCNAGARLHGMSDKKDCRITQSRSIGTLHNRSKNTVRYTW